MTATEAKKRIRVIDREVSQIQRRLRKAEVIDLDSASSWQQAWDKHPDMLRAESALYRERGELQVIVGVAESKIAARENARRKIAEVKSATKHTGVFSYLHDCKKSAELLGLREMAKAYADALATFREVTA